MKRWLLGWEESFVIFLAVIYTWCCRCQQVKAAVHMWWISSELHCFTAILPMVWSLQQIDYVNKFL